MIKLALAAGTFMPEAKKNEAIVMLQALPYKLHPPTDLLSVYPLFYTLKAEPVTTGSHAASITDTTETYWAFEMIVERGYLRHNKQ